MVGSADDCRSRSYKIKSYLGHLTFVEVDNEIISVVITTGWLGHKTPNQTNDVQ